MSKPNTRFGSKAVVGDKAASSPAQKQQQRAQQNKQQQQRGDTSRPHSSSSCSSAADGVPVAMTTQSQITEALEALLLCDDFCDRFAARIEDRLRDSLCATVTAALEGKLQAAVDRIDILSKENEALKKKVEQLQIASDSRLDGLAQYQRRNNVRVSGVPETEDDEVSTSVVAMADLLNSKLGLAIRPDDIDRCHRVGRKARANEQSGAPPRPRQVLIKFISYQRRSSVISSRYKLKSTGISIHEDLTKPRHIFLRRVAEKVGYKNVWSRDGKLIWRENGKIFTHTFNDPNDRIQLENS